MTTTDAAGRQPAASRGRGRRHEVARAHEDAELGLGGGASAARPPEQHPLLARLDSPLSTYYLLIGSIAVLLGVGLVMVLSASSVSSYGAHGSLFTEGLNQARYAAIGMIGAVVASRLPVLTWKRLALPILLGAVFLQILVFTPLGVTVLGNRNWLRLGPVQIQPSEFGKIGLILFAASVLAAKRRLLGDWKHIVIPTVAPATVGLVALVLLGGDLGTTTVLVAILFAILWTAGIKARYFGFASAVGAVFLGAMALAKPYRVARILGVATCQNVNDNDGKCWQAIQGQFALADGGIWGQNLGASREKWGWLPEQQNDFIFAIIGEELGILGTFTILVLVILIAFACYRVILQSDDMFTRLATAGVMAWFVSQAILNIGSVIGLLPVIGVPLPLVSAGGSALITTLFGLGMVVSFARNEPACRRALAARPHVFARSLSVLSPLRKRSR